MDRDPPDRTALVIAHQAWNWGGCAIGSAIIAAAKALLGDFGGNAMVEGILRAVGYGLFAGGGGIMVIWVIYTCWQSSPGQRLKRLAPSLIVARNAVGMWQDMDKQKVEDMHAVRTIIRRLDKLKIPHPKINERGSVWNTYLKRLIGEANAGAITEAKLVWGGMVEAKEPDGRS